MVPVARVTVVLHHLDLVDVFDGGGQLVRDFEVARAKLALTCQLVEFVAQHIAQIIHCFLAHVHSPFTRFSQP